MGWLDGGGGTGRATTELKPRILLPGVQDLQLDGTAGTGRSMGKGGGTALA